MPTATKTWIGETNYEIVQVRRWMAPRCCDRTDAIVTVVTLCLTSLELTRNHEQVVEEIRALQTHVRTREVRRRRGRCWYRCTRDTCGSTLDTQDALDKEAQATLDLEQKLHVEMEALRASGDDKVAMMEMLDGLTSAAESKLRSEMESSA